MYKAYIVFGGFREEIPIEEETLPYDAKIRAAKIFLEKHPQERLHDDRRRPYPIPIRPYWLVVNGHVHLIKDKDRRKSFDLEVTK